MSAPVLGNMAQIGNASGVHIYGSSQADSSAPREPPPRQLPADVPGFVNRDEQLQELDDLIGAGSAGAGPEPGGRPVTMAAILGSAGVGKTALALRWAHRVSGEFPDGQLYVDLRGFGEEPPVRAGVVLDRFLRGLGESAETIPADLDERAARFRSLVAGRRILIVLDNAADVGQVLPLVPGGSDPFVLVTSRNHLRGLAVRHGARRIRLDVFTERHAIELLNRVTTAGDRRDSPEDLAELARLCARLPLALRMAAERAISRCEMGLPELIADLRDESMLWDALSTDDGPDGETVRTVFAWSYRNLPPDAARVFRALGLHRGPDISLPVAAAAAGLPVLAARRSLDILIGSFLVGSERSGRYQLHDLLRAYALDQARAVDPADDRRETVGRIARWYIATAFHASQLLVPGRELALDEPVLTGAEPASFSSRAEAFGWFDAERPNLVANARSAGEEGLPRQAWELAMVLGPLHSNYFTFDDWSVLSELAVTAAEEIGDPAALASALDNRGLFLLRRGALDDAKTALSRALAIQTDIGDERGALQSLNSLGLVCLRTRSLTEAIAYFTDIIDRARAAGESRREGAARSNLGYALLDFGDVARAMEILAPLPEWFARRDDQLNVGTAHYLMAWGHRLRGDYPAALESIDAALRIAEDAGNRVWEASWLIEAVRVRLAMADPAAAMRYCQTAAALHRQLKDPGREATALDCEGEVRRAMGKPEEASAFHREAARMHHRLGDDWQEALALIHLADCEAVLGHADDSRADAARALALIERYTDDRAAELKDGLRRGLA